MYLDLCGHEKKICLGQSLDLAAGIENQIDVAAPKDIFEQQGAVEVHDERLVELRDQGDKSPLLDDQHGRTEGAHLVSEAVAVECVIKQRFGSLWAQRCAFYEQSHRVSRRT